MKIHILIGFLFASTVAGLPVQETSNNDILTPTDYELFGDKMMYMYDDNQNLVRLTLNNDDEPQELIDVSKRVFFYLYTTSNPLEPQQLYVNNQVALQKSNFDPKKPTRFITHGWINSRDSAASTLIRDAYIQNGDYNVIVIDWSKITMRPYVWASLHVKPVGLYVSTMINFLQKEGMDLSQTTMVGHSLGAHVVGLAARHANGDVKYVVGLDPALPGFYLAGAGSRIAKEDADYVEIIHTNAGLLGYLSAIGNSDFFPNGGSKQHGCILDPGGACSHARSFEFFAESINSQVGFHGKKCESFVRYKLGLCNKKETSLMGGHKLIFKPFGNYYLTTKATSPFAKGL